MATAIMRRPPRAMVKLEGTISVGQPGVTRSRLMVSTLLLVFPTHSV